MSDVPLVSCFCSDVCKHFRLGVVKYSTAKANVDDIFKESDTDGSIAGSTSILKSPDMTDIVQSDLTLNIDDPDGLLDMSNLDIDPKELFPEEKKRPGKKKKINKNNTSAERDQNCKEKTEKRGNEKTSSQKPKKLSTSKSSRSVKSQKEKWDRSESDDCSCIICGALYKEDTTGQDWIQCIICRQWAQLFCFCLI